MRVFVHRARRFPAVLTIHTEPCPHLHVSGRVVQRGTAYVKDGTIMVHGWTVDSKVYQ